MTPFCETAGVEEAQLKLMGRWKSGAYNLYVKQGRVGNIRAQKDSVQKDISGSRL